MLPAQIMIKLPYNSALPNKIIQNHVCHKLIINSICYAKGWKLWSQLMWYLFPVSGPISDSSNRELWYIDEQSNKKKKKQKSNIYIYIYNKNITKVTPIKKKE